MMLAPATVPAADRKGPRRMGMSVGLIEESRSPLDVRRGPSSLDDARDDPERAEGSRSATVEVISDYDAFVALEAEWNDAVERARIPHPFLRHEWVRTWWDAFSTPATRLHIQIVRAGGGVTAIAPFMRDTAVMYGIPARRVRFIHNDHTPRTDIIVAGDADASYRAIWRALREDRERWDILQLSQLERDSRTQQVFREFAAADRLATGTWRSSDSPYLQITGTWEGYLNGLSAKFRSNLRNRLSRLTKIGSPSLEVLTDRRAIEAASEEAYRLESSGWKREAGTAIASDPAVHRFYTALIERGASAGWLQLLFLKVGDRRIATSYGACFDNRLFLFKTGYDPEFATGAPFKILTSLAIQEACARGLTEVDFLGDAEPWKLEWTSTSRGHDWLYVFGDTMRARLLHSIKFEWLPELKKWRS
jgi:CelD/BcsL family acetyltransferase involved in cellulose biosynthesis